MSGVMRRCAFALCVFVFASSWLTSQAARSPLADGAVPSDVQRPADPVVLTGADVPTLSGITPQALVAWRYQNGWEQIPVQVDERAVVDFGTIYNFGGQIGVSELVYTDAQTWTGADSNPQLDANDEIVFMARDAGNRPPTWSEPSGVMASSGREIVINDPTNASAMGYVYLFQQTGSADPSAGQRYITYTFSLDAGAYKPNYHIQTLGPNPEHSVATSPSYQTNFSDRWINDHLRITAATQPGSWLERQKVLFQPTNCTRTENTFANGVSPFPTGAFIANKSGPVRAIRSFLGANSGPLTQRDHILYGERQEVRTALRVHTIPGIMDLYDYASGTPGLQYFNNLNQQGVAIDAQPEQLIKGPIQWELINSSTAALVIAHNVTTDIPNFSYTSFYTDTLTPSQANCTGDSIAYGLSGVQVDQEIPCTDRLPPFLGGTCSSSYRTLKTTRTMYYRGATTPSEAAQLAIQANTPLSFSVQPWSAPATPTFTLTPTASATNEPPSTATSTATSAPPTATQPANTPTATVDPPTATGTINPSTATPTVDPPTATGTLNPSTATPTVDPPTATSTLNPSTATPTIDPPSPTASRTATPLASSTPTTPVYRSWLPVVVR